MIVKKDIKFDFITATLTLLLAIIIPAAINFYGNEELDLLITVAYELIAYVVLSLILSYAHYKARIYPFHYF